MQIYKSLYTCKQAATGYTQAKTPITKMKNEMGRTRTAAGDNIHEPILVHTKGRTMGLVRHLVGTSPRRSVGLRRW
jgi:hypothetical protein